MYSRIGGFIEGYDTTRLLPPKVVGPKVETNDTQKRLSVMD